MYIIQLPFLFTEVNINREIYPKINLKLNKLFM